MIFSFSKSIIWLAAPLLLAMPTLATAQSQSSLSGLYGCEAITHKDDQLACFLRETAKLRAVNAPVALESVPVPTPPVIEKPAPPQVEFAPLPSDKPKAAKSQTVAIQSTSRTAKGYIRFTLANGEVWQQIEKAYVRLGRGDPDMLTIKRKSMGSFIATVNEKRPSFRIKRIK